MTTLGQRWRTLDQPHREIEAHIDRALQEQLGLSTGEFVALSVLQQHSESTSIRHRLYEVSAEVGLTQSATSRLVTRLHERELLMRRPSDHDRRSADIELTDAALSLLQRGTLVFEDALSAAVTPTRDPPESLRLLQYLQGQVGQP
ncbi:MarR family winged helix-turn-helix transcriptional regulator [Streptomyces sp. NPDC056663]|uniref:MarR family winged helix-turn-helix transcriptional regulator n=1 Tax=Streptomyces sp. NPDC056663 TaxID=3345899 RepID=UPI0036CE6C2B